MGLFDKLKESMGISEETEVSKLDFKRCDGFAGSAVQRFADVSIPVCPICRNNPRWQLHVSQKTVKMFPLVTIDFYYFLKCSDCNMVMHTTYRQVGNNTPRFMFSPSPRDNMTMMKFDILGDKTENFELAGKEMSIWEINQMAEK